MLVNSIHIVGNKTDFYFDDIVKAARVFPLDFNVREQRGKMLLDLSKHANLPPEFLLDNVNAVLKNDPYAYDYLANKRQLENILTPARKSP